MFFGDYSSWSGSGESADRLDDEETLKLDDGIFSLERDVVTLGNVLAVTRSTATTRHVGRLDDVVSQKLAEIGQQSSSILTEVNSGKHGLQLFSLLPN